MSRHNITYDIRDFTWDKDTSTFIGYANTLQAVVYSTYLDKLNPKKLRRILCWKTNPKYTYNPFPSNRSKFYISNISTNNRYRFILYKDHGEYLEFTTECKTYTCKIYV